MKTALNDRWFFTENFTDELINIKKEDIRESDELKEVRIPHTVKLLPLNYFSENEYQMVSGYVRKLFIPEEWKGRSIVLTFGAAAHEAEVFLNGESIMKHSSGYTAFSKEIADLVNYGEENILTVRLDSRESLNIPPFGKAIDYMTFGGLYRGITLEVRDRSHIEDVFVTADMHRHMSLKIKSQNPEGLSIRGKVTDKDGKEVLSVDEREYTETVEADVKGVGLWNTDDPHLYNLELSLLRDGEVIDTYSVRFGFRTVEFKTDGFYLNGIKFKIRGLNRHQSWPYMGYAVPDRGQRLDADILKKELGCNAVRTSHYPQSQSFYDRCDEIGLLVFTEFPGWQYIGDDEWRKQALINVSEMVLQYRNHPSIFIWGVRINESADCDELYEKTNEKAHELDHSRPTGGVRNFRKSHLLEDVYTYNEFYHIGTNAGCEPKANITSDVKKPYLVTEYNGHMYPTKSYDWERKRLEHALRHANVLNDIRANEDISGSFGWCMFDYNTHQDFGAGDRVCYHGVMDMFRNPKIAASVYAAEGLDEPVLEVSSSMDIGEYPAGSIGDMYAFTNLDEVWLYKNGEFVKAFKADHLKKKMLHPPILIDDTIGDLLIRNEGMSKGVSERTKKLLFDVAKYGATALPVKSMANAARLQMLDHMTYQDGERLFFKYIASWGEKTTTWRFEGIKDGKSVKTVIKEPVQEIRLVVDTDTDVLREEDTWDMATVRIKAVDQCGNVVPYINRAVRLNAEGAGETVGPDVISFAGGFAGTYIRTNGHKGEIVLTVSADDLGSEKIKYTVERGRLDE